MNFVLVQSDGPPQRQKAAGQNDARAHGKIGCSLFRGPLKRCVSPMLFFHCLAEHTLKDFFRCCLSPVTSSEALSELK